jgi:hypothetical protein
MISCLNYTRLTGSWLYLLFPAVGGLLLPWSDLQQSCTHKPLSGLWGWEAKLLAKSHSRHVIKKHLPHCILNPDCVVNHATTVLSRKVHMNVCLHSTKRKVKNTDSHAQRKMQCEHLTSGLQVTAGTTATMHVLNQTGGCQLNNTLRMCHGAFCQLLHSNALGQPHTHTHTQW